MNPTTASRNPSAGIWVLLLVLIIAVGGYFGWQYYQARQPVPPVDYVARITGPIKRAGVVDKLAPEFVDTNGDLVPDGPKDAANLIDPAELVFCPGVALDPDTPADWQEWMDALAAKTGKKVKFQAVDNLDGLITDLVAGTVHVTSFNTGYVPTAVNRGGFIPATALATADGHTTYSMEFIVPAKSTIRGLADIKGKKLTLGAGSSYSGFKAPLILLRDELQLRPGADYDFVMVGGHDAAMKSVASGRAEVAAVAGDLLADAAATGNLIKPDQFRSIYQSKPLPKGAFGYTCKLKPDLAAKVKDAFLTFNFQGTKLEPRFKGQKAVRFAAIDYQKDWAYVREIDEKMLSWK